MIRRALTVKEMREFNDDDAIILYPGHSDASPNEHFAADRVRSVKVRASKSELWRGSHVEDENGTITGVFIS